MDVEEIALLRKQSTIIDQEIENFTKLLPEKGVNYTEKLQNEIKESLKAPGHPIMEVI